jgi:hypothetical protein
MRRGVGKWIDNLQLFDDRAGPSVRDDERQRIFMLRTNVNEMNIQPVDFGDELRQGVQSCLALAPIVFRTAITRERLSRPELHALGWLVQSGNIGTGSYFSDFCVIHGTCPTLVRKVAKVFKDIIPLVLF